jgi:hypothetical protein
VYFNKPVIDARSGSPEVYVDDERVNQGNSLPIEYVVASADSSPGIDVNHTTDSQTSKHKQETLPSHLVWPCQGTRAVASHHILILSLLLCKVRVYLVVSGRRESRWQKPQYRLNRQAYPCILGNPLTGDLQKTMDLGIDLWW